jgi:hypothetical protein
MSRTAAKGVPEYKHEAEEAFCLLYDRDVEDLTRTEKLLAALSLCREARKGLGSGPGRCGHCERITYEDWDARKLQQIYNGLVLKLRHAVNQTLSDQTTKRPVEDEEIPGDSL